MAMHAPNTGASTRAPKLPRNRRQASHLATPLAAVDAILASFGRENLELAIETLIARLDAEDGDPDLEEDDFAEDDDPAGGNRAEDDFGGHTGRGPGCPIADGADIAWEEPGDRQATMMRSYGIEDEEDDAPELRQRHLDRIRATRCDVTVYHNPFTHQDISFHRVRA